MMILCNSYSMSIGTYSDSQSQSEKNEWIVNVEYIAESSIY